MKREIKEDILITTPMGTKLSIKEGMVIKNPIYSNRCEPLFEESNIRSYLSWLEGEIERIIFD